MTLSHRCHNYCDKVAFSLCCRRFLVPLQLNYQIRIKKRCSYGSNRDTREKGLGRKVQAFGSFLSSMIMPNIGAFIAWGFIAAIFIDNGWYPNKELSQLAGLMITYLIPLLIAFSGGRLIHDLRGGIVAATATMGVIVALPDTPMLLGAMIMGPLVGWLMKKVDQFLQPRTPQGFEMLFNNFSAGILAFIMTILEHQTIGANYAIHHAHLICSS